MESKPFLKESSFTALKIAAKVVRLAVAYWLNIVGRGAAPLPGTNI